MDARDFIRIGMSAERLLTVTHDITVQHVLPSMPAVYGTPFMILEMEMTAGDATMPHLPDGFVSVGTVVDIRHLAATPVGGLVRTTARVTAVERKAIWFDVEAYYGATKIGDGRHARGVINVANFLERLAATSAQ